MSNWKPIETAPKDGTLILLYIYSAYGTGHVKTGLIKDGKVWSRYDDGEALGEITESSAWYWMPLPEPPQP